MLTSLATRLPGVFFETAPVRPADELPRMDVAAFVGFAASGPLHMPVAVEDVSRFRDIFGGDLPLAWDEKRGEQVTAWLSPAVEAFFRNGGKRCWVVRVADEETAQTLEFAVPGLRLASGAEAVAQARSPGEWAAALNLGTVLVRERFALSERPGPPAARFENGRWRLSLAQTPRTLVRGDLLEVLFPSDELALFLFVEDAEAVEGVLTVSGGSAFWRKPPAPVSPPDGKPRLLGAENPDLEELTWTEVYGLETAAEGSPGLQPGSVHRLTFDMLAWRGASVERRLEALSFSSAHPRFWASLPGDADLFRAEVGRRHRNLSLEQDLLRAEANLPRFPFAGLPGAVPVNTNTVAEYLPQGMSTRADLGFGAPADVPTGLTDLELDGLAEFDDRLFLDSDLARSYTGSLGADAEHKYSLEALESEDAMLPVADLLRGIHTLTPVQEVSMIAVPDALHRGWTRQPPSMREPLAAPHLDPVGELDELGRARLSWTAVAEALEYRLEYGRCRNFSNPRVIPTRDAETEAFFVPPEDCPAAYFFRVRAERRGEVSAWSNSRAAVLPPSEFDTCGAPPVEVADLVLSVSEAGSPDDGAGIGWEYENPAAAEPSDNFELQLSLEHGFSSPESVPADVEGLDPVARTYFPGPFGGATRYYRVRAVRNGRKGVWSNTVALKPASRTGWTLLPEAEYLPDTLVAVQRALIRFCAARADAVALLSLPRAYREMQAIEHLGFLLPQIKPQSSQSQPQELATAGLLQVPALTHGELDTLSYAAVYHPWVAAAQAESDGAGRSSPRVVWQPPDGPAAGRIAARTLRLGAWVAPANEPINAAIGLDPALSRESWGRLTEAQFNLLVNDPRGFVIFNAETLSRRDDLRPLNVRRLMILLRRLALREGATFVFEPNSDDFRGLVRQRFNRALSGMYLRGAFAGASPAAGFRVVVDESVNPPSAIEIGRFVVELRVAPSQPFRYLTVRLEQSSPERLTVTES